MENDAGAVAVERVVKFVGARDRVDWQLKHSLPDGYRRVGGGLLIGIETKGRAEISAVLVRHLDEIRGGEHPPLIEAGPGNYGFTGAPPEALSADMIAYENAALREQIKTLRTALGFAASCIKSGEPWTPECEQTIGGALRERA